MSAVASERTISTLCPMSCHPTLCGMRVTVAGERLVRVEGDPDNPDSRGFLCLRGRAAPEIIGNPAGVIESLALDYAETRRALILVGGSSMHKGANGRQAPRAIARLPALTGKVGIPGGGLGPRHGASAHGLALSSILPEQGNACRAVVPNQMPAMLEAFEAGRIEVPLLSGTDMLSSFADRGRLEPALARVDLIVCHDLFANDAIRACADVELPGTAWLEQLGCKMTHTHVYLMDEALPTSRETGTLSRILPGLAERTGLEGFFPWADDAGLIDAVIDHPSTGHVSVAALRAEGGWRAMTVSHQAHPDNPFSTPSGKVEFYSERAVALGLPGVPVYEPVPTAGGAPALPPALPPEAHPEPLPRILRPRPGLAHPAPARAVDGAGRCGARYT